ncbi:helix-turn-helix domain-containing protein [Aquimarina pacifica]|uniref:helix-turn-helix domain-containing protein n=1 Tax=Aquimarina pacifica TaxID=1296415 RepID=UPI00046FF825|nr:AraC family transcriptional regulator [Aquimarina pacifica]
MKKKVGNTQIASKKWELENIILSHNIIDYTSFDSQSSNNDTEYVRLHFGLSGEYDFDYKELNSSFSFTGHHNNIMYSKGLTIDIHNKSKRIETFGINFTPETFANIAQNGPDTLKRFTEKVLAKENTILSKEWRPNTFRMQSVINEILHCHYTDELKSLFLLSKSIELLVLQAELHNQSYQNRYIKHNSDKQKLFEAKELLTLRIENPPTILELSKLISINEYKLKKGFKELFGTTIFGFIHQTRMTLAKKLLLGTTDSAKEIAYKIGYSSPQHFSKAFKKEFGVTPDSIRKYPD